MHLVWDRGSKSAFIIYSEGFRVLTRIGICWISCPDWVLYKHLTPRLGVRIIRLCLGRALSSGGKCAL